MREAAVRATFVQLKAPYVWTTLALTLRPDGSSPVELAGASDFPRHWVYDATGGVVDQRNSTDYWSWLFHSYGPRTPWADGRW